MTRMTARIEEQLIAVRQEIDIVASRLNDLKAEESELSIALDVVKRIVKGNSEQGDEQGADTEPATTGLRERILKCFDDGKGRTKDEVAAMLATDTPGLNVATVGSLLSRYVKAGELIKVGRSHYQKKNGNPSVTAEGLSESAT